MLSEYKNIQANSDRSVRIFTSVLNNQDCRRYKVICSKRNGHWNYYFTLMNNANHVHCFTAGRYTEMYENIGTCMRMQRY